MNKKSALLIITLCLWLIILAQPITALGNDDFCYIGPQDCKLSCGYDPLTGEEQTFSFLVGSYIGDKDNDIMDIRIGYYYNNEWQGWIIGEARHDWLGDVAKWEPAGDRYHFSDTPTDGIAVTGIRRITRNNVGMNGLGRVDLNFPQITTYTSSILYGTTDGMLNVWRTYGLTSVCQGAHVALFSETWDYNSATSPDMYNSVRCKCDITGVQAPAIGSAYKQRFWHKDGNPTCEAADERSDCNNGADSKNNDYCLFENILPDEWDSMNEILEEDLKLDVSCNKESDTGYDDSMNV